MSVDGTSHAELLASACPSIRYRLGTEILSRRPSDPAMSALRERIPNDPAVREVLGWQQPDGWLAWAFHGTKSIEAGIRLLCEKGLAANFPPLARALEALERHEDRLERGIGKVGPALDEMGFGGSQMIRAFLFACAGLEERPLVRAQVETALKGFAFVPEVRRIEDIFETYKGKLVFKPGIHWPGIYHLRLLAFTDQWRTAENRSMLVQAVQRLVEFSPLPSLLVRSKSRLMSPASFCMLNFKPDLESLNAANWMMWFHRMECLARLGVVGSIPALQSQIDRLAGMLTAGDGRFTLNLRHDYFTHWGAYTGLMLEPDWRSPARRVNDLTFRSLLILHYAKGGLP
jgi:hypothetical protein